MIRVGELGGVSYSARPTGGIQARARTRDAGGNLRRISATGTTREAAYAKLVEEARVLALRRTELGGLATLSELLDTYLDAKHASGRVREQTLTAYARTARHLREVGGALPVADLTPGRVQELLGRVIERWSVSAGHSSKSMMNQALAMAVRRGIIAHSPMLYIEPLPPVASPRTSLTVDQVMALRAALRRREDRLSAKKRHGSPVPRLFVEVALGSGLRVNEVLGLRHADVDLDAGTIAVTGELVHRPVVGIVREEYLKASGQERIVELPSFAVTALTESRSRCLTVTSRLPDAPAIPSEAGTWMSGHNIRRALRSLKTDAAWVSALAETGLQPSDVTPHALRRTTSTLLAIAEGNDEAAQRLLGHASPSTTRRKYITRAYRRVGAPGVLDALLGGEAAS